MNALESMDHGRKHGISPSCLHPLLVLIKESPLPLTEISKRTGTSSSNITALADTLEKHGWVTRTRISTDRRKILLQPTKKALDTLSPLMPT